MYMYMMQCQTGFPESNLVSIHLTKTTYNIINQVFKEYVYNPYSTRSFFVQIEVIIKLLYTGSNDLI